MVPPPFSDSSAPDTWQGEIGISHTDLFESAFHYAAIGMCLVGLDGRFLRVNRALCTILGYSEAELLTLTFQDLTHPDDLRNDLAHLQALQDGKMNSFDMEKRYFHKAGHLVWGHLSVSLMRDESGAPLLYISQIQDVTERKRVERSLERTRVRFAKLVENLPMGVLAGDETGRVLFLNQPFCDLFGIDVTASSLMNTPCDDLLLASLRAVAEPAEFEERLAEVIGSPEPIIGDRVLMRDGRILERDFTPIVAEGISLGHLWLYRDVTDRVQRYTQIEERAFTLQRENSELERMAVTDELTGIGNRRAFTMRLESELIAALMYHTPLSLVMADIDHFKSFNDDYGHPVGDIILREVGQLLSEHVRSGDFVVRYGGEEFAILLPHTDVPTAFAVAERLRETIETHAWTPRPITASFGIATLIEPQDNTESSLSAIAAALVAVADNALYRAKRAGRNRVVHASGS